MEWYPIRLIEIFGALCFPYLRGSSCVPGLCTLAECDVEDTRFPRYNVLSALDRTCSIRTCGVSYDYIASAHVFLHSLEASYQFRGF